MAITFDALPVYLVLRQGHAPSLAIDPKVLGNNEGLAWHDTVRDRRLGGQTEGNSAAFALARDNGERFDFVLLTWDLFDEHLRGRTVGEVLGSDSDEELRRFYLG